MLDIEKRLRDYRGKTESLYTSTGEDTLELLLKTFFSGLCDHDNSKGHRSQNFQNRIIGQTEKIGHWRTKYLTGPGLNVGFLALTIKLLEMMEVCAIMLQKGLEILASPIPSIGAGYVLLS